MKKVVLATNNASKISEIEDLLQGFGFEVKLQSDFAIQEVEETGLTFIENAIIKARFAAKKTGLPAIADDSGLEVDYLKGAPGVYSSRYAGKNKTDDDNIEKLLVEMKNVPKIARTARFHCVLVYLSHAKDPTPIVCHATFEGEITDEKVGNNGFGYDPVFYIPEQECTAAELEPHIKKRISHRAKALKLLFSALEVKLNQTPKTK